jgi:hypothetical protein
MVLGIPILFVWRVSNDYLMADGVIEQWMNGDFMGFNRDVYYEMGVSENGVS